MKVSEKSDVHPLFFSQLLSYFLSAMRQGFYSIFTSSSPLKSSKVAKSQKMSIFETSKNWTPKIIQKIDQISNFVSVSYMFQSHLDFNETGAKFEILSLTKNQNQMQFERLLEFLVAYNSVIWAPCKVGDRCPTIHHKSPFASPIRH